MQFNMPHHCNQRLAPTKLQMTATKQQRCFKVRPAVSILSASAFWQADVGMHKMHQHYAHACLRANTKAYSSGHSELGSMVGMPGRT
jgi:hypothetical protein